jgi:aryl-alcohol dehydrogenase-like predicted oxidoreductase
MAPGELAKPVGSAARTTSHSRLCTDPSFRAYYFRDDRKQQVYERVKQITSDLKIAPDQIAETALRFVLSHRAVSTVIPGMRSVRNVDQNCALGDGHGLPAETLEALRKLTTIFVYRAG